MEMIKIRFFEYGKVSSKNFRYKGKIINDAVGGYFGYTDKTVGKQEDGYFGYIRSHIK